MKQLAMLLIGGGLAAASIYCGAETTCPHVVVPAAVEAGQGELTLADLLAGDSCPPLRQAAARVNLGRAPRPGRQRVLDGRQILGLLEEVAIGQVNLQEEDSLQIPGRIVVRRGGAAKSCLEIARFVAGTGSTPDLPSRWRENLNCAAARSIAEDAALELTKTSWNAGLQRWEFALRCPRPDNCVPFLVWVHDDKPALPHAVSADGRRREAGAGSKPLVQRGQTATLTWEQSGIRIVMPVTCLDAGGAGQFVRVRFKNAARILRAEVVGDAMLRANL